MNVPDFKYELFFELSPDLLCIAGYDGYFKKINRAVSELLGYTMEELYSRPINDFVYHADKDITARVRGELTRSKPLLNFENRYVTKDGKIVWLSWTSLPVDSDQLVFAIAKNITHKKKLESERNEQLANLTRVNKDLKQLSFTTSHDLRSPIHNLLNVFSLIDISKISDKETLELIEILKLSGEQLNQTVNNYVDALSEKQTTHASLEEIDLKEILDGVLQSINSLIQTSKATIHVDFSRLRTIRFNKSYLESVFLNLITNSIKYARPDRPPVISIHSEKINGSGRLIVSDNGLGFDMKKVKNKLFGLHQKFHDHVDSKGIGLYLVYNHVTSLGGKISVESKVNEGAKFIISFKG
ncbi:MAG: PAS domain-containing sensor histidine kinase [Balneolales bacterium]